MKIDLYHLHWIFDYANFVKPFMLRVLRTWTEPLGHEVRTRVCRERDVDLATDADVVAFSVYTRSAPAVYRLCQKLRARGKVVVLGGPHFDGSDCLDADGACDVVAESINEEQWKGVLRKIENGRIAPNRRHALVVSDAGRAFRYPDNCREAAGSRRWYQVLSVPASLGCPHRCDFCNPYMPGRYLLRSVDSICREIASSGGRTVFLCDASFGLNKRHTIELMHATSHLGKRLSVQTTLSRLTDAELVRAMALGGVRYINVGIESLERRFAKHGKAGTEEGLRRAVGFAHEMGIVIQGNFICGFDNESPEVFEKIHDCYTTSGMDMIAVNLLTPYPNTALYRQLEEEGRIIDTDWEHYDCGHVVYEPRGISAEKLIDGFIELFKEITGVRCALKKSLQAFKVLGFCRQSAVIAAFHFLNTMFYRERRAALGRDRRRGAGAASTISRGSSANCQDSGGS